MLKFKYILFASLLLSILSFIFGTTFLPDIPEDNTSINESADNSFSYLFLHNLRAGLYSVFIGSITVGLYSLFYLFINFFTMGVIVNTLTESNSIMETLSTFLLHGIFEVPAMLLAASLGIYIPLRLIQFFRNKRWVKADTYRIGIIFLSLVAFTLIAAFIEGVITPQFIKI
ncbi:stage II sporulation protein M [Virgibacillus dokdonensis]|nr:stage II sporulation protein M [Virgibacillus dokdonensis]